MSKFEDLKVKLSELSAQKERLEKQKAEYENIIPQIEQLSSSLDTTLDSVSDAQAAFASGGYSNDGVTLDNGDLAKQCSVIETDIDVLEIVIEKCNYKLEEIIKDIESNSREYESVKQAIDRAVRLRDFS